MKINNFTDYSLRVLIYLAIKGPEKSTVGEIAKKYHISQNHLVKVVHNLSNKNLIASSKGRGGGLLLAREPGSIAIGDLVKELEEGSYLVECFSENGNCKINPSCKLKGVFARAQQSFYQVLNEHTLKDIVSNDHFLKQALNIE
jgi:Rrf2 family nitric oxide-sensitive transcriptional repressor